MYLVAEADEVLVPHRGPATRGTGRMVPKLSRRMERTKQNWDDRLLTHADEEESGGSGHTRIHGGVGPSGCGGTRKGGAGERNTRRRQRRARRMRRCPHDESPFRGSRDALVGLVSPLGPRPGDVGFQAAHGSHGGRQPARCAAAVRVLVCFAARRPVARPVEAGLLTSSGESF
jgi:hypothetical protein